MFGKYFTREKMGRFYPMYEALESIIIVRPYRTKTGAHIRDHYDMKRLMITVIIALVPVTWFTLYNIGFQHYKSQGIEPELITSVWFGIKVFTPIWFVGIVTGSLWEGIFALVRKHDISEGFLVTGLLIPLIVPPTIPLWQVALSTSFGVVIGKEVFGGTGMNVFNPALVTRAFIFFAYPGSVSGDTVWTNLTERTADTFTSATPLAVASTVPQGDVITALADKGYDFWTMFIGLTPGSMGETSALAILLGAVLLLYTNVASWRVMLSTVIGGVFMATLMNLLAPSPSSILALPAHYHLVMGSFAFGAVYMATDPVSSAQTNLGKLIYGFFIGALIILVRVLNPAYTEGTLLAILFMNAFAPLIDHIVVSRNIKRRLARAAQ